MERQVNQRERADDRADEKSFSADAPPDQTGIGQGDHSQRADPDLAMVETKFMPQRARSTISERVAVRQAVSEVNQPGREKQSGTINWIDGRLKSSSEEAEPGDGDQRGVETNQ